MGEPVNWFDEISRRLGVEFDVPFTAVLGDGTRIQASARVRNFGAVHGMLLLPPGAPLKIGASRLLAEGYGYCVMDTGSSRENIDLDAAREMLADWGWTGDAHRKPSWLR
jgi:hypothetical protein